MLRIWIDHNCGSCGARICSNIFPSNLEDKFLKGNIDLYCPTCNIRIQAKLDLSFYSVIKGGKEN